ncbi:MAG: hypothetical protein ACFNUO_01865 [Capnocytophaga ochracea]
MENVFIETQADEKGQQKVIALVKYPTDSNPLDLDKAYMDSPLFKEDMEGFLLEQIVNVSSLFLSL